MLKCILGLTGVQVIDKEEQREILGAGFFGCKSSNKKCCVNTPSGVQLCDNGRCIDGKYCLWI
ncbi:hypothetical protein ACFSTE_04245 [Aquimarina hainanensis]|uniref:Natural product n=1 Tax=Aquimarina hainanensis TaxID=1578017 RepID=A0ABW5N3D9_9FLAO|nr:hypothetical protein [Aquimarina sp. TRL1]QKX06047.1 hypothetical protein HN014_14405 [Aquimarina sp. TRL1]